MDFEQKKQQIRDFRTMSNEEVGKICRDLSLKMIRDCQTVGNRREFEKDNLFMKQFPQGHYEPEYEEYDGDIDLEGHCYQKGNNGLVAMYTWLLLHIKQDKFEEMSTFLAEGEMKKWHLMRDLSSGSVIAQMIFVQFVFDYLDEETIGKFIKLFTRAEERELGDNLLHGDEWAIYDALFKSEQQSC